MAYEYGGIELDEINLLAVARYHVTNGDDVDDELAIIKSDCGYSLASVNGLFIQAPPLPTFQQMYDWMVVDLAEFKNVTITKL